MTIQRVNMGHMSNVSFKGILDFREGYYKASDFYNDHEETINNIGLTAAAIIVVGGLIHKGVLLPSIKANKVAKKALMASDDLNKTARETIKNSKKLLNSAVKKLQKGIQDENTKIVDADEYLKFMQEYKDGVMVRETKFHVFPTDEEGVLKYTISQIREFNENNTENVYKFKKSSLPFKEIIQIEQGLKNIEDGRISVENDIRLKKDNSIVMFRNVFKHGNPKYAQDYFVFDSKDNISQYIEKPSISREKGKTFDVKLVFDDDKKIQSAELRNGKTLLKADEDGNLGRAKRK